MSTLTQEQLRREELAIAKWAEGKQALPREVLAKLKLLGSLDRSEDDETGVGNVYGGDNSGLPSLGPLASFGSWQSVASTVLRKAEDSAGFDPSSTEFDAYAWYCFEVQFMSSPVLTNGGSLDRAVSISSLSLWPAISAVTELTGELVTSDTLASIINSIRKIGQLAVQNKGQQQKNSNVQQGFLTVADGDVRLGMLRTTVQMEYQAGKGYQQLNQQITVSRLDASLDYDKCRRNADLLLEWDGQDVDDWVNGTSSSAYPPNTSPAWDDGQDMLDDWNS